MIVRPPLRNLVLALLLGVLCAFAVACGEKQEGLISANRAEELRSLLDKIDDDVASVKCDALTDHLQALRRQVGDLPGTVDRQLRQRIREGLENLESRSPAECRAQTETTETTTTTETVPETVPTETVPEVPTETTPTTPPETTPTTPPETTPTVPPPTAPTPTTPADPGDGGGGTEAPLTGQGGGTETP